MKYGLKPCILIQKRKCFKYSSFDLSVLQPQRADFAYLAQQLFSGIARACRQTCWWQAPDFLRLRDDLPSLKSYGPSRKPCELSCTKLCFIFSWWIRSSCADFMEVGSTLCNYALLHCSVKEDRVICCQMRTVVLCSKLNTLHSET